MSEAFDLVVVGTGFASTFFLKAYLERARPGTRVLVLERGHLYPHHERVKERRGEATTYASLNPRWDQTFINQSPRKRWSFQTGFGGSSNCWYGCTPRFLPNDFRMRTLYGVGADWPITYDDLEPHYQRVEELMAIAGPARTPFPKSTPYPLPPHRFTRVDQILQQRYGDLYISQPTARASVPVNNRQACCSSALCAVCPINAKFTIENSGFGVYEDPRVELRMGSQAYALETSGGVVRNVVYRGDGADHTAAGEVVALGANAIFNAHILLNSGDTNPFTGRGLGEQYGVQADVMLDGLTNLGGSTWVNANGYMLYDGPHRATSAACLMESSNHPYVRMERGKWRDMASFRLIFEALPDERNHVAASDDLLRPTVTYLGHGEYVEAGVERVKRELPQVLADLPVESIRYTPHGSEAHVLGTTRMSPSPETGVVDRHLIHHAYRNLFVLGSGAYTTYSPNNPTLTLSALSLHAAAGGL